MLLTIKMYDKVADLAGRENYMFVGSKFRKIVGSTNNSDALQDKIKAAKFTGLSRLEVSFRFHELPAYSFD